MWKDYIALQKDARVLPSPPDMEMTLTFQPTAKTRKPTHKLYFLARH